MANNLYWFVKPSYKLFCVGIWVILPGWDVMCDIGAKTSFVKTVGIFKFVMKCNCVSRGRGGRGV